MNVEKKSLIKDYLRNQIIKAEAKTQAYVFDEQNRPYPKRPIFSKLQKYIKDYIKQTNELRWVILHGVRGVGKTTLLSQLYLTTEVNSSQKLYLSIDQARNYLNASLIDILEVYQEILNIDFDALTHPIYLFLDEIQYEPEWALTLKTLYDRSKKIFIFATGSSATALQSNPDVARRAVFQPIRPLAFSEYLQIRHQIQISDSISQDLEIALFESQNSAEVINRLKKLEPEINKYLLQYPSDEKIKYFNYGTLPFTVKFSNEELAFDQIKKLVEKVTSTDIPQLNKFDRDTQDKFPNLLYLLAGSDTVSLKKLSDHLQSKTNTIANMLDVLVQAGLLNRIYPYGASYGQVKKPSKYLFATPSFRAMYFNFIGHINQPDIQNGKLLEDTVGAYLLEYLESKIQTSLTYDSATKGADFILSVAENTILLEVGFGKKDSSQITNTAQKVKAKYGLCISKTSVIQTTNSFTVKVPIDYFLFL